MPAHPSHVPCPPDSDLKGASIPVSKWHKLAQDKENWEDLISETGEEPKKSKAKEKRKRQWNPFAPENEKNKKFEICAKFARNLREI